MEGKALLTCSNPVSALLFTLYKRACDVSREALMKCGRAGTGVIMYILVQLIFHHYCFVSFCLDASSSCYLLSSSNMYVSIIFFLAAFELMRFTQISL